METNPSRMRPFSTNAFGPGSNLVDVQKRQHLFPVGLMVVFA